MKILKDKCKHCDKEISSLYQKQLDYNLKAHEIACEKRNDQLKDKKSKELD